MTGTRSFSDFWNLCVATASAPELRDQVPAYYRGQPEEVMRVALYGAEHGLDVIESLRRWPTGNTR